MIANRAMFVAVLLAGNALAVEPKPVATLDDFAFGYTLNTPSGSSVYQVALPEEVYRLSRRDDLGDMRVFNAQTEVVPYALMRPPVTHEAAKRVTLSVFPVYGGDRLGYESLSIRVVRDQRGTIVNINNKLPMEKHQPVTAYMIDVSQVDAPLAKLYVHWGETNGFVANVSLSRSDDLNRWSVVVNSTALADLIHGSERLTRDVIEFRPIKAKYFQLTWPSELQGSSIVAIEAELAPTQQEPAAAWLKLEGQRVKGDDGRELFGFDTGGRFPIDRLNLGLPENNSLVRAVIWSRPDEKSSWQHRYAGLFYRIQSGKPSAELSNEVARMVRTMDRYWRVDITPSDGLVDRLPTLDLGWVSDRVTFLARGSGPYMLAFGGYDIESAEQPIEQFFACSIRTINLSS